MARLTVDSNISNVWLQVAVAFGRSIYVFGRKTVPKQEEDKRYNRNRMTLLSHKLGQLSFIIIACELYVNRELYCILELHDQSQVHQ